jgi:hypothetical protein
MVNFSFISDKLQKESFSWSELVRMILAEMQPR